MVLEIATEMREVLTFSRHSPISPPVVEADGHPYLTGPSSGSGLECWPRPVLAKRK